MHPTQPTLNEIGHKNVYEMEQEYSERCNGKPPSSTPSSATSSVISSSTSSATSSVISSLISITTPFITFVTLSLLLSTIHWMCIQIMATYCAPCVWYGPLVNLLNLGSPMCVFVNNVQITLSNYYIIICGSSTSAVVAWITIKLTPFIYKKIY
jgi:hypothetical protein